MPATRTTVVRPPDPAFASALRLALLFAAVKLLIHVATNLWEAHLGWGYFRDEFYYVACGHHLDWGYVDHGPLVAVQARLAELLFGHSLAGLRFFSALGGASRVFLTGILAWSLGGRRPAQFLSMLGVLIAPAYLGTDSFLSMNSCESLFWMTCLLCLILMQRHSDAPRADVFSPSARTLWMVFGISAGIGLLNKPSMTFFLIALLFGLLLTPARCLLRSRYAALGIALLVLIPLPNLLWQVHHGWPTLEFLRNGEIQHKNIRLAPLPFIAQQIMPLHPLNGLIWLPGLVYLLRRSHLRFLGLTYLFFLAMMIRLGAKDYYVQPIYPVLFAAGGLAWERIFARRRWVEQDRALAFPVATATLVLTSILILPMAIPVLTPNTWIRYTRATHLYGTASNTENQRLGALPQFFSDRFGWEEHLALVERAWNSLSPEDRQHVTIYADNYGEAGALDMLGPLHHLGLPPAISGHNTYWIWGPRGSTMDLVIAITGSTPEDLQKKYSSVTVIGRMDHPLAMPHEHKNVYLLRGRRPEAPFVWSRLKDYI